MRTGICARNLKEFEVSLLLESLGIVSAALGPRGQGVVEDQCNTTAWDCPDIVRLLKNWQLWLPRDVALSSWRTSRWAFPAVCAV